MKKITVEKKVLSENDKKAAAIRQALASHGVLSLNFVSSPGSGKTSLLEKTLASLVNDLKIALIAGDVQTENDADRLIAAGGEAVFPLVTGGSCHLDAKMISDILPKIDLDNLDLLIIENVGNLVCPASYDLGEDMKIALISTTEGHDKPLKYPGMFRRSSVLVINKTDLLGTSDFDVITVKKNALKINADLKFFETSCRTGDGLKQWFQWLSAEVKIKKNSN